MNSSMIRVILGHVLRIEAALLLLPCLVAVIYRESVGWKYLFVVALCAIVGSAMSMIKKPQDTSIFLRDGCVATAASWIVLSLFGAMPFTLTGEIPSYLDALFETMSGFTTTGASILDEIEALSYTSLFWRSFTHWIGGMGVLVFLLAIIPMSGGSNINLMKAESPGPSVGKLVPKIKSTARILYVIYFCLTIAEAIFLLCGGMNLFEALTLSFGTAGTGGFAILSSSIASYNAYCQWVITVFMILFGVNFNAYYLILLGKLKKAFAVEEVKWYFAIVVSAITIISINISHMYNSVAETIRTASFQVATIITTTGYATADFDLWPTTSKFIIIMLMIVGACAGSTGGGIKVSRIVVVIKTIGKELNTYIHPKSVKKIQFEGKPIEHEVLRAINVYMIAYLVVFFISVFILSFENLDMTSTFTAVLASLNNIGPGLSKVGPSCNFGFFSNLSKVVLIIDMLAGRLELFPLLILFHPQVIKQLFFGFLDRNRKYIK